MKTKFRGLIINIENPAGSTRSGVDPQSKEPWSTRMPYDYGEIVGSTGVDGDPIDCFIGPDKYAKFVYVIHQLKKHSGEWDEDKCMLGWKDGESAKQAYFKCYDKPELFFGSMSVIPFKLFKTMIKSGTFSRRFMKASMYSRLEREMALHCGYAKSN